MTIALTEPARAPIIALCLSGGGFRAALFHLGAVRRLNELGVLGRVSVISSVSGGSILAGHLAERVRPWPAPGESFPDWETRVAVPFRAFCAKNIRTGPILRRLLNPLCWFDGQTQVRALERTYHRKLTGMLLRDLPATPRFIFCATDLAFGVNWVFEKERVGDYQVGYAITPADWSVARAVAASSCFPPIFGPQWPKLKPDQLHGGKYPKRKSRDALIANLSLTDGGVYDNMATEPIVGDDPAERTMLISDGGAVFRYEVTQWFVQRLWRYASIVQDQAGKVRRRWLIEQFKRRNPVRGAYWSISSAVTSYGLDAGRGYSKAFATDRIAPIRTDLDAFSAGEAAVLENHGYSLADAGVRVHLPDLLPPTASEPTLPHPAMDEVSAEVALIGSQKRRWLGRN